MYSTFQCSFYNLIYKDKTDSKLNLWLFNTEVLLCLFLFEHFLWPCGHITSVGDIADILLFFYGCFVPYEKPALDLYLLFSVPVEDVGYETYIQC